MITFLKLAGQIITKGVAIFTGLKPLIAGTVATVAPFGQAVVQTIADDLERIKQAVIAAEAMGQALALPGNQKLVAVTPLVAQVILQSSALTGHQIAQPELFNAGAKKIADGMADVLNSLHAVVETQSKLLATPVA